MDMNYVVIPAIYLFSRGNDFIMDQLHYKLRLLRTIFLRNYLCYRESIEY